MSALTAKVDDAPAPAGGISTVTVDPFAERVAVPTRSESLQLSAPNDAAGHDDDECGEGREGEETDEQGRGIWLCSCHIIAAGSQDFSQVRREVINVRRRCSGRVHKLLTFRHDSS